MSTREQVFGALFALGSAIQWLDPNTGLQTTFQFKSRRVKSFDDLPGQPAFMQAEGDEQVTQRGSSKPGITTLKAHWIVYHKAGADTTAIPAATNNAILDAAAAALSPVDNPFVPPRFTLGGLAHNVYIDGRIFKDPGDLDQQGLLVIPISILLPL